MEMDGRSVGRLRIGELAMLTNTTARAIRHYHAIGLLDEPARDASGYRRYGPEHLVALTRIRRLRSLDMPLDQIALHLSSEPRQPGDLSAALRLLADDISRQIDELQKLRSRILDMSASGGLDAPIEIWSAALREHGLLDATTALPPNEHVAVELIDALHPGGIEGVVAQASALMSEPAFAERLDLLLRRFRALPDEAEDGLIDALAADYVQLFPRPESAPPAIDLESMDKLMGDRLSQAQQRCVHQIRRLLEDRNR
jgi:DNA-binding transcriptional MerR regulator